MKKLIGLLTLSLGIMTLASYANATERKQCRNGSTSYDYSDSSGGAGFGKYSTTFTLNGEVLESGSHPHGYPTKYQYAFVGPRTDFKQYNEGAKRTETYTQVLKVSLGKREVFNDLIDCIDVLINNP